MAGALEDSLHVFSSFPSLPVLLLLAGVSACTYERLCDREIGIEQNGECVSE